MNTVDFKTTDEMSVGTGLFILEQTDYWTATIKAARSLRGKFGNYTLHVETHDLGTPSNKDNGILEICVTDYNDNPPLFIRPQHNTTIRVPEVRISALISRDAVLFILIK